MRTTSFSLYSYIVISSFYIPIELWPYWFYVFIVTGCFKSARRLLMNFFHELRAIGSLSLLMSRLKTARVITLWSRSSSSTDLEYLVHLCVGMCHHPPSGFRGGCELAYKPSLTVHQKISVKFSGEATVHQKTLIVFKRGGWSWKFGDRSLNEMSCVNLVRSAKKELVLESKKTSDCSQCCV